MKKQKLANVGPFDNIYDYVKNKINMFSGEEKTFRTMFCFMFSEEDNVFAELSDGYRIKKITYGQMRDRILRRAAGLKGVLSLPAGSIVGLYAENSPEWIETFWATLMCGYNPLLINLRLSGEIVEKTLNDYCVKAVLTDGASLSVTSVSISDVPYSEQPLVPDGEWGDKVIFMSSGTTENVKLCAYTAENFYYQIGNSVDIVEKCPEIASHYEGELKLLTLLPFYHVFGFIAVYMWFGFFSRTFVFLKDLNPQTLLATVKKHKVTHVFAVPLVWETIAKTARRRIAERGEKTYKKFNKALRLSNSGKLGRALTAKAMAEIREKLVGDSVRFMISGGSAIDKQALELLNGIGYHIANGYGMTEVGITSVEISPLASVRNLGSVGAPFKYTEYKVDQNGRLLIRGKNMASVIMKNGVCYKNDFDAWFNTGDLATQSQGRYYLSGREDDLVVSVSGENLNPTIIEGLISVDGAEQTCLVSVDAKPTLVVSAKSCYSEQKARKIIADARLEIERVGLAGEIHDVLLTPDKLIEEGDFKLSRRKLAKRISLGRLNVINDKTVESKVAQLLMGLEREVAECFAQALRRDVEQIGIDLQFFTDLGGTSLDYFVLSDLIKNKFGVDVRSDDQKSLTTVNQICLHIRNK